MDGPVSVSISSKKVVQTTRTVGGYTFSHFGDEPDILQAKGSVILMPGREGLGFLSLLILKTLYRLDKKAIKIFFKLLLNMQFLLPPLPLPPLGSCMHKRLHLEVTLQLRLLQD